MPKTKARSARHQRPRIARRQDGSVRLLTNCAETSLNQLKGQRPVAVGETLRECLKDRLESSRARFGVPALAGPRVRPPKGGTPNGIFRHALNGLQSLRHRHPWPAKLIRPDQCAGLPDQFQTASGDCETDFNRALGVVALAVILADDGDGLSFGRA